MGRLPAVIVAGLLLFAVPVAVSSGDQSAVKAGNAIFGITKLHRIHLSLTAAEWAVLQTSGGRPASVRPPGSGAGGGFDYQDADGRLVHIGSGFGLYFPWARADVRVDDPAMKIEFKDAGLRYKGNLSFNRSTAAAPLFANFKLKLDVHGAKGTWDGEKTFNLHAGVVDTSKMRDALAFAVFRAAGVPSPRTAYVELFVTVPGIYQNTSAGLFTLIEEVNKKFLERTLPPGTGLLMKPEGLRGGMRDLGASWASYSATLRPDRDATPHEQERVMAFGQLVTQPDVAKFQAEIGSFLDVDGFLRFVAVNSLVANTDSYLGGNHNFFLYLDPADDKFRFIPWDQDLSMGGMPFVVPVQANAALTARINGVETVVGRDVRVMTPRGDIMRPFNTNQTLLVRLFDDPATLAKYRDILKQLATSGFTSRELLQMIDDIEKVGTGRGPSPREFITGRTAQLQQLVAGWQ